MALESDFNISFVAALASREKQIQQNYRPIIGVHKWFARRPGSVFRSLLLSEFVGDRQPLDFAYWTGHELSGLIADPFMGGGTPVLEANRLGFGVIGVDINPMAHWVVRQELAELDIPLFEQIASALADAVEDKLSALYSTRCNECGSNARVKYFLWVKSQKCPECDTDNALFPGYLLAENRRHPSFVVACPSCWTLNETKTLPNETSEHRCSSCSSSLYTAGPAKRNKITCRNCDTEFRYPPREDPPVPEHKLWGIEYHCEACKPNHKGRFFKTPDADDHERVTKASNLLRRHRKRLPIPAAAIPDGDETRRLHRWGYHHYHELFNSRQLFALGTLLDEIKAVADTPIRHALLTVFSDILRYHNMVCRYDTYALKCQDIFSVHGYPVGLVQCENNVIGIPRVGSGGFRHFVAKYIRAKEYAGAPFETSLDRRRSRRIPTVGERISATFVSTTPANTGRETLLMSGDANESSLPPNSLDGVFTDPPYYDNVQYAELMDFCYVWLRQALNGDNPSFTKSTTRAANELTGNATMGRGLEHFTTGLSAVFSRFASALKPNAPFAFTYHHNDPTAYAPVVISILDANLACTTTLAVPAEMGASLHIARSQSSVLDTVFVCRVGQPPRGSLKSDMRLMNDQSQELKSAGLRLTEGDTRCMLAGILAARTVNTLHKTWDCSISTERKLDIVTTKLETLATKARVLREPAAAQIETTP